MARLVPIALALAALVAVLFIVFGRDGEGGGGAVPSDAGGNRSGGADATLTGGPGETDTDAPDAGGDGESRTAAPVEAGGSGATPEPRPCAIEGVVVDQEGRPVPGLVLLLDRTPPYPTFPGDDDRWLRSYGASLRGPIEDLHAWGRHLASATTDEEGAFRMELPNAGRWRLTTHVGAQPGGEPDVAATGIDLTVSEGTTRRLRMVVHLARYVSGWVFLPDGSAPRDARVWTERREIETRANADGFFRLGPMVPGRWKLIGVGLRQDGRSLAGGPVDAETGQEEVEIWLRTPRELRGRVVDESGGVAAMVHGRHLETGAGLASYSEEETGFLAGDLEEGTWRFVAHSVDGRFGLATHEVPGLDVTDLGEVVIQVSEGAVVRLTNGGEKVVLRYALIVDETSIESARLSPGQSLSIEVPAGECVFELQALASDPELGGLTETGWEEVRTVAARSGEEIPLLVVPQ
jgi:hypothetical protein